MDGKDKRNTGKKIRHCYVTMPSYAWYSPRSGNEFASYPNNCSSGTKVREGRLVLPREIESVTTRNRKHAQNTQEAIKLSFADELIPSSQLFLST